MKNIRTLNLDQLNGRRPLLVLLKGNSELTESLFTRPGVLLHMWKKLCKFFCAKSDCLKWSHLSQSQLLLETAQHCKVLFFYFCPMNDNKCYLNFHIIVPWSRYENCLFELIFILLRENNLTYSCNVYFTHTHAFQ